MVNNRAKSGCEKTDRTPICICIPQKCTLLEIKEQTALDMQLFRSAYARFGRIKRFVSNFKHCPTRQVM